MVEKRQEMRERWRQEQHNNQARKQGVPNHSQFFQVHEIGEHIFREHQIVVPQQPARDTRGLSSEKGQATARKKYIAQRNRHS